MKPQQECTASLACLINPTPKLLAILAAVGLTTALLPQLAFGQVTPLRGDKALKYLKATGQYDSLAAAIGSSITISGTNFPTTPLPNSDDSKSAPIPIDQIGAAAGKQYQGDGLPDRHPHQGWRAASLCVSAHGWPGHTRRPLAYLDR